MTTRNRWPACKGEDGPGPCVWDGRHQGNGEGRSYIVTRKGRILYIRHAVAHLLTRGGRA